MTVGGATTYPLTLGTTGTGTGTVSGGGDYSTGMTVNLTAEPNPGSVFAGWSPSPCAASFNMPGNALTCTATFNVANAAPTATASISGDDCLTGQLTGSYVYADSDTPADEEDTANTKFQWYNATKSDCSDKAAISGATTKIYTPAVSDSGKYICFGVTPAAKTGTLIGTEKIAVTKSAVATPVYSSDPSVSATIAFGTIAKPATATKTLTVTNAGSGILSVTGITLSDTTHFSVSPSTADIACTASKSFTITCNGTEKGNFTATMSVAHNGTDSPANYNLSCEVTAAPVYNSLPAPNSTLTMTSCSSANATSSLKVTNTGSDDLKILVSGILKQKDYEKFSVSPKLTDINNPLIIAVGKSQTFTITALGSASGNFNGILAIGHNAAGSPTLYNLSSVISDCYVPSPSYEPPPNTAPVADILYLSTEVNKPVNVKLSAYDADAPHWFILLVKPINYSVVTQPKNGTLTGTIPNLTYTPNPGFVGTDSFTYKANDGIADSAVTTVPIIVHQNSNAYVGDNYAMTFFCVVYDNVKYGFVTDYTRVASDPSGLYWKMNMSTFGKATNSETKSCITVDKDLKIMVPSALYQGTLWQFTLDFMPVAGDSLGMYWKMDINSLKPR